MTAVEYRGEPVVAAGQVVMVRADPAWESWAPPLFPPTEGGLDRGEAQSIADAWWDEDRHVCAMLMWEFYAATLPPELPVAMVTTGSQAVSYGQPTPGGEVGAALARAQWHRSFVSAGSAPLHR